MSYKFLSSVICISLLAMLYVPFSLPADPTFNIILKNNVLTDKVLEFDVYAQSTAPDPIQLAGAGLAFQFNTSALNGGTVTASIVPNSSELSNTAQVPSSFVYSVSGSQTIVIIPAMIPPGGGNGSLLSTVDPGTKLYILRLTNSNNWVIAGDNVIDISTAEQYPISITAYVSGANTIITGNKTVLNEFTGTLLPVELSSFSSNVMDRSVEINWSTKTEKNSSSFEVERTLTSSTTWLTVASVKAAGLSNSPKNYSYPDTKLQPGKYQYRLKMIDNDGSYQYSSVENAEVAVPKNFAISQNYPNPFNPSTKIDYQLPADAKILIDVFNITGQKVSELVNREQPAGYYTVDFGASNLASGIYIYRLSANNITTGKNFTQIKKMILLK